MFGFTIPNTPDSGVVNQNQAEPDSLDFFVVGNNKTGVVSGMLVTAGSGDIVNIASGEVLLNGTYYQYGGGTSSLTTYTTAAFFDVVVARVNTGTGVVTPTVIAGTTSNPRFPSVGTGSGQINPNTDVVLATVWRDGTVVDINRIVDKRSFIPSSLNRVQATTNDSIGNHADLSVRSTSWAPDATLAGPISVKVGSTWYQLARYSANFTAGTVTASSFVGPLTGNASTASQWATSRTITLSGNASGSVSISGSSNVTLNVSNSFATNATNATYADTLRDPDWGNMIETGLFGTSFVANAFPATDNAYYMGGTSIAGFYISTPAFINVSAYSYSGPSDRRDKTDIKESDLGLEFVKSLKPVSYKWIVGQNEVTKEGTVIPRPGVREHYGFIAQEVKEALDNAGVEDAAFWRLDNKNDPESKQSLLLMELISPIVKAVQELSAKVDALEAQVG